MVYPHPQHYAVMDEKFISPEWSQWFTRVRTQTNKGIPPSNVQSISAADGIKLPSPNTNIIIRIQGSVAGITDININPQIEIGFDGQVISVVCQSATNKVKLDNGDGLSLTGGASITLGANDTIIFHCDKQQSLWIENSRSVK